MRPGCACTETSTGSLGPSLAYRIVVLLCTRKPKQVVLAKYFTMSLLDCNGMIQRFVKWFNAGIAVAVEKRKEDANIFWYKCRRKFHPQVIRSTRCPLPGLRRGFGRASRGHSSIQNYRDTASGRQNLMVPSEAALAILTWRRPSDCVATHFVCRIAQRRWMSVANNCRIRWSLG